MPIYVRDLPEPVQQLVRSMNRECTPEELQMLSLANSKDVERVEEKLADGEDPVVTFVELKNKLRSRTDRGSSEEKAEARKHSRSGSRSRSRSRSRGRSRSRSRGRGRGRSRSRSEDRKKRRRRRSRSSSSSSEGSMSAARRREERRKRLAIPQNMIAGTVVAPVLASQLSAMQANAAQSAAVALAQAAAQVYCRVYVGNIVFEVQEPEIRQIFEAHCGQVKSIEMSKDATTNLHRGYCFIEFTSPISAQAAMDTMNGHRLHGRTIRVGRPNNAMSTVAPAPSTVEAMLGFHPMPGLKFMTPGEARVPPDQTIKKVYVSGLPQAVTEDVVRAQFAPFGDIKSVAMHPDRLLAILEYGTPVAAEKAVKQGDGLVLNGVKLRAGRLVTPPRSTPAAGTTRCVVLLNMVGRLEEVDDALGPETKEHCDKYGEVEQVMIYDEVNAATKKVEVKCFVLFKEPAAAVRAQKALHGKNFGPRRVSCEFFPEADFQKILES
uniref:RRM domain-containing protein n=1 Tax=Eutreptiella gymnastica TaxID=73025 RepID=A0A7S4G178_9EUGL|mmetsp:Transcript_12248/g.22376  ORF Transcript_12248/g.22376 Transcript_12248/m.22376 type:complete len:493 (-) Transcript_12248:749-2227(-)